MEQHPSGLTYSMVCLKGRILEDHLPNVHAYADDTQLYVSFKPNGDADQFAAVTAMQNCIDDVKKWMLPDKLKLNDDETEFILIGTRQQLAKANLRDRKSVV